MTFVTAVNSHGADTAPGIDTFSGLPARKTAGRSIDHSHGFLDMRQKGIAAMQERAGGSPATSEAVQDYLQAKQADELADGERAAPGGADEGYLFPDLAPPKPVSKPRRRRPPAPDRAPQKMPRLSYGERQLLDLLRDLAHQQGYAFPTHAWLAERLHSCEKTVRKRLDALAMHGLLSWSWTGRENHYDLAPESAGEDPGPSDDQSVEVDPTVDVVGAAVTAARQGPPLGPGDPKYAPGFTEQIGKSTEQIGKSTDRQHDMSKEDSKASSSAAAAAKPEEKQANHAHSSDPTQSLSAAADDLTAIGLPRELAEHYASEFRDLAPAVVQHCRERFADSKRKPIASRPAYIRGAFANPDGPGGYGFTRDDAGRWHPPRDGPAKPDPEDRAKVDAELVRQRQEDAARAERFQAKPARTMRSDGQ